MNNGTGSNILHRISKQIIVLEILLNQLSLFIYLLSKKFSVKKYLITVKENISSHFLFLIDHKFSYLKGRLAKSV